MTEAVEPEGGGGVATPATALGTKTGALTAWDGIVEVRPSVVGWDGELGGISQLKREKI